MTIFHNNDATFTEGMSLTSLKSGGSYDLPGGPLIEGTFLVFTGIVQNLKSRFVLNFYTARGDVSTAMIVNCSLI